MDYSDAIKYLKEHNITKDDGSFYEFGEVRTLVLEKPQNQCKICLKDIRYYFTIFFESQPRAGEKVASELGLGNIL